MIRYVWLGLALLSVLAVPAHAEEDCVLTRVASLQMSMDRYGRPTIPMKVGDQNIVMLVDSGGAISTLTDDTVTMLHLQKGRLRDNSYFQMYGGSKIRYSVVARNVVLDTLTAPALTFLALPEEVHLGKLGLGGTFSPDILRSYDAEFDFAGNQFNLYSQKHCRGKVVNWSQTYSVIPYDASDDAKIELSMTLDGKDVPIVIDTGSAFSVMSFEATTKLFGIDPLSSDLVPIGPDKPPVGYRYPFKKMTIGDIAIDDPPIVLIRDAASREQTSVIGMDILRRFHIYIAYYEHKLYITPADAH